MPALRQASCVRESSRPRSPHRRARRRLHRPRLSLHVHEAHGHLALSHRFYRARLRSARTSLISPCQRRRPRMTSGLLVSIETGTGTIASAGMMGNTRLHSSAAHRARPRPRRLPPVDGAALSRTRRAARAPARTPVRNSPPSEKESGVTLSTPITRGRASGSAATVERVHPAERMIRQSVGAAAGGAASLPEGSVAGSFGALGGPPSSQSSGGLGARPA